MQTIAILAVGTYPGQIVVTSQGGAATLTVMANLTVTPTSTAFLDNLPGQMSFWMQPGGTAVSSQFIQVRNGGTGSLDWNLTTSAADGGSWLNTNVNSGTAPTTVTVGVNVANLPNHGTIAGRISASSFFPEEAGSAHLHPSERQADTTYYKNSLVGPALRFENFASV